MNPNFEKGFGALRLAVVLHICAVALGAGSAGAASGERGLEADKAVVDDKVDKVFANSAPRTSKALEGRATVGDVVPLLLGDLRELTVATGDFVGNALQDGAALLTGSDEDPFWKEHTFKCVHCGMIYASLSDVLRCETSCEKELFTQQTAEAETAKAEAERAYAEASRAVEQSYRDTNTRFENYVARVEGEASDVRREVAALRQDWDRKHRATAARLDTEQAGYVRSQQIAAAQARQQAQDQAAQDYQNYQLNQAFQQSFGSFMGMIGSGIEGSRSRDTRPGASGLPANTQQPGGGAGPPLAEKPQMYMVGWSIRDHRSHYDARPSHLGTMTRAQAEAEAARRNAQVPR